MNLLCWNFRRLGNQSAIDVFSHLVREKAPKMLFLMEMKRSMEEMQQIQADLPYHCMLAVPSILKERWIGIIMEIGSGLAHTNLLIESYLCPHIQQLKPPMEIDGLLWMDGRAMEKGIMPTP